VVPLQHLSFCFKAQPSYSTAPTTYSLKWLNEGGELKVAKQGFVLFSIGKMLKDEVICDMAIVNACHLLLVILGNLIHI